MQNNPTFFQTYRWPVLIVGLLVGHVTLMMFCVTFAVSSHARAGVTPDYYQKALHWDDVRRQQRINQDLGWAVTLTPDVLTDIRGNRNLLVQVTDAEDEPIDDADVRVSVYHAVYPGSTRASAPATLDDNGYRLTLPMRRGGLWHITVDITRGDERFVQSREQRVANVTQD